MTTGEINITDHLTLKKFDKHKELTVVVNPSQDITEGDTVFYAIDSRGKPITGIIQNVIERRPSKGTWNINPRKDWVKIQIA